MPSLTSRLPAFGHHVRHVLSLSAFDQVLNIHAQWRIAGVHQTELGQLTLHQKPSNVMSPKLDVSNLKSTVFDLTFSAALGSSTGP